MKKMSKMSKRKFMSTSFTLIIIYTIVWAIFLQVKLWGDAGVSGGKIEMGAFHIALNIFSVLALLFLVISLINEATEKNGTTLYRSLYQCPDDYNYNRNRSKNNTDEVEEEEEKPFSFGFKKRWLIWGFGILFFLWFWGFGRNMISDGAKMYNKSKTLHNAYTQKVQEKAGFYDKLWKTYLQKEKITNVNKETFILVTKIIMENRRDGQNVTWKWLQENQQIPYSEFTKFYADLSDFITTQREGYFNIETQCQAIANSNNTLLDTFPNNLYNKLIGCQRIQFEYGILSDSTLNVINSKKENLK